MPEGSQWPDHVFSHNLSPRMGFYEATTPMKNILPLLLAAALGSAATYFIMDAKQSSAAPAPAAKGAPRVAGGNASADPQAAAPAADGQRKTTGGRTSGKSNGFLPEEIPGVSPEQLTKCRAALMKTFRDEGVNAARNKVREIRKELEGADDAEKKNIEADIAAANKEVRKAQKAAMVAADPDITDESADKVLDALEELMKQRMAQFGNRGGNNKGK